jgi:hypothetical protein
MKKDSSSRSHPGFRGHRGLILALALALASAAPQTARGQDASPPGIAPPPPSPVEEVSSPAVLSLTGALKSEAARYVVDGRTILLAPLHWSSRSWTEAAVAAAAVAALTQEDARIDAAVAKRRSAQTDSVSRAVTPLGSWGAIAASVAPLGAGLLFKNPELRDTGRDAIEAEIFAAGIAAPLLKTAVGRLRPAQGSDADEFRPLSSGQSFPSGHATEAFAVASVFAARSQGWVVPVVAYTLASGVAFARVNDRAHFASDVVAGALIGTAIGHTIVHRHVHEESAQGWTLVPVTSMAESRRGYGIGIQLGGP